MLRRFRDWLGHLLLGLTPPEVATVRSIAADFAQIRLEWAETLDLMQHWAQRQAKRDQRAVKAVLAGDPLPPSAPVENGERESQKSHLRQLATARRSAGLP